VRSSGSACTMRSRAIRARARQLFVICSGEHVRFRRRRGGSTHDESIEVGPGPFTCEVPLRSSLRIGNVFGQKRSQRVRLIIQTYNIEQKERISFNNIRKCGG